MALKVSRSGYYARRSRKPSYISYFLNDFRVLDAGSDAYITPAGFYVYKVN
jgi:hypothetical protein